MYCELKAAGCERSVSLFYLNMGLLNPSDMMNSEGDRVRKEVVVTPCGGFLTEVSV
jgi:hypothetical protein